MTALVLQSCLKDKEHESDIYKGVDSKIPVISFNEPNTIRGVNILKAVPAGLPILDLPVKLAPQEIEIPVVCIPNPSSKPITVTIKYDGLAQITAYNEAQKVLPALPAPQVPAYPAGYIPFVELPAGKYTLPTSITIPAGAIGTTIKIAVPSSGTDFSLTARYLLPITLVSTDGTNIVYPSTLIKILPKNKYAGVFRYKGKTSAPSIQAALFNVDTDYTISTISETQCLAPVGSPFATTVNMTMTFSGNNVIISRPPPPNTLSSGIVQFPALLPGNTPVLTFNAQGKLQSIKNIKYDYKNGAGAIRTFEMESMERVAD